MFKLAAGCTDMRAKDCAWLMSTGTPVDSSDGGPRTCVSNAKLSWHAPLPTEHRIK